MSRDPRRRSLRRLAAGVLAGVLACAGGDDTPDALAEGEAMYRQGDFEGALEIFDAAHGDALEDGDSARAAVAMTWMGLAHYQRGEYGEARRYGEEALTLKERLDLADELPRSLNALGLVAWGEGRLAESLELYERSLEAARSVDDDQGVARALNNVALVRQDLGALRVAGQRYREAQETFRELELPQFEGRVLTNLGALHIERGDAVAAERALLDAFELYRQQSDPVGEVNALGQLGVVYAAQGDPHRGLEHLDSARTVAQSLGLRVEEASNLEQLANIHWSLGSERLALDLFERADAINLEVGLEYEHGANLRARSALHRELGNLDFALGMVEEALELHEAMGASAEVLADLLELARLRWHQGRRAEAERHLERAAELARSMDADRARIDVALARAELAEEAGDPVAVLDALSEDESVVGRTSVDHQWRWTSLEARARFALGHPDAAATARRAVDLVERIRASIDSRLLRGSLTRGRAETYHTLVHILLEEGRIDEAFEISDASRGRELVRALGREESGDLDPARRRLAEAEELLVTIGYLDRRIDDWYASTPPEYRDEAFEAEIGARMQERERARLEYSRLAAQQDGPAEGGTGVLVARRVSADDVRQALEPDEAILEFLVTEDRTLAFVIRTDGVRAFPIDIARDRLKSRLRVARALAGDPDADLTVVRSVMGALFELLIRPPLAAGALEGAETLVVIPDAHLTYLPFAALHDGDTGRYLVEARTLVDAPSAAVWMALRQEIRSADGPVAQGGAGFAPFPDELPASATEVRRFAELHPGSTHIGDDATESRLREALESGMLVHAAAHGVMNARNPLFSRLVLHPGGRGSDDDGVLQVHEMLDLRSVSPLVFLSACETGAGSAWTSSVTGGEEYAALSQAILAAGARGVVGTLWPVEDAAAADFASLFYDGLATRSAAESLTRAQREMLVRNPEAPPFFWAGYRMTGEG